MWSGKGLPISGAEREVCPVLAHFVCIGGIEICFGMNMPLSGREKAWGSMNVQLRESPKRVKTYPCTGQKIWAKKVFLVPSVGINLHALDIRQNLFLSWKSWYV